MLYLMKDFRHADLTERRISHPSFGHKASEAPCIRPVRWFFRIGRNPVGVDGFFGALVAG